MSPKKNERIAPAAPRASSLKANIPLLSIVFVVVVIVSIIAVSLVTPSQKAKPTGVASAQLMDQVTNVPSSTLDSVGVAVPLGAGGAVYPQHILSQPALHLNGTNPALPSVLYVGAEYCPFCAAERWPLIIALGRFGHFTPLKTVFSAPAPESYPNTPTFSFLKAKYVSKYFAFQAVETETVDHKPLEKLSAQHKDIVTKYDSPNFIAGMPASSAGAIPFIDMGNQYLVAGSSYSPSALSGLSRDQIASALSDASAPTTQFIETAANYLTASLCQLTKNAPASVCSSKAVADARSTMGIK